MDITLRILIADLINIIRGAKPIDDEPISDRQVETWIHQYRSLLLKRDLDKGYMINPDYIQNIDDISLEYDSDRELYRTSVDLPNAIDLHNKSGITFVGDRYGNQIQLTSEKRVNYQEHNKWAMDEPMAYLNNKRIYLYNPKVLTKIYIRGVFENPVEAFTTNGETYDYDSSYPIPMSMIVPLKEMILKTELNIIWQAPSDDTNNAKHNLDRN